MRGFLLKLLNFLFTFTTKIKIVIFAGIKILPDGPRLKESLTR